MTEYYCPMRKNIKTLSSDMLPSRTCWDCVDETDPKKWMALVKKHKFATVNSSILLKEAAEAWSKL